MVAALLVTVTAADAGGVPPVPVPPPPAVAIEATELPLSLPPQAASNNAASVVKIPDLRIVFT
jgi:hypothetical protein